MSFGIFQEYYTTKNAISGNTSLIGVIGTTLNARYAPNSTSLMAFIDKTTCPQGLLFLSQPPLFALLTSFTFLGTYASLLGAFLAAFSLVLSSLPALQSTTPLIFTFGILHALGCSLLYSVTILNLDSWFSTRRKGLAYGAVLSAKGVVGAVTPFTFSNMLNRLGALTTLRIWAAAVLVSALSALYFISPRRTSMNSSSRETTTMARHRNPQTTTPTERQPQRQRNRQPQQTSRWRPLLHSPPFYLSLLSTLLFSLGYAVPPAHLPTYYSSTVLHDTPAHTSSSSTGSNTLSPLLLALLSAPGVPASLLFGLLSDGALPLIPRLWRRRHHHVTGFSSARSQQSLEPSRGTRSARLTILLSALGASLAVLLLWGLAGSSAAGLITFAVFFGFFGGGFSATWSGMIGLVRRDIEARSARNHETRENDRVVDQGLLFGLLNGVRGVGSVVGGLIGVALLNEKASLGKGEGDGIGDFGS